MVHHILHHNAYLEGDHAGEGDQVAVVAVATAAKQGFLEPEPGLRTGRAGAGNLRPDADDGDAGQVRRPGGRREAEDVEAGEVQRNEQAERGDLSKCRFLEGRKIPALR